MEGPLEPSFQLADVVLDLCATSSYTLYSIGLHSLSLLLTLSMIGSESLKPFVQRLVVKQMGAEIFAIVSQPKRAIHTT